MKIKYFKNYENLHDCYVGEKDGKFDYYNIVSISKDHFFLFANDESSSFRDGRFDGFYRFMNISKNDFESLKEAAKSRDRGRGIGLIKKIHKNNSDNNPHAASIEGSPENFDLNKTFDCYRKANPILE
ncbi:hypothetical protein J4411_02330 [Candidatus Pacearchaeota archaeon]|nr:hypothetical protein [Candidatus Pacearchaeota archaeon]